MPDKVSYQSFANHRFEVTLQILGANMLLWYLFFSFALFFIFWIASFWLVSYFSGWQELAKVYGKTVRSPSSSWSPESLRWRSLQLSWWASYSNCVRLDFDFSGCEISLPPWCDFGHRPLHIPWSEISLKEEAAFIGKNNLLYLSSFPTRPIKVCASLASAINEAKTKYLLEEK